MVLSIFLDVGSHQASKAVGIIHMIYLFRDVDTYKSEIFLNERVKTVSDDKYALISLVSYGRVTPTPIPVPWLVEL